MRNKKTTFHKLIPGRIWLSIIILAAVSACGSTASQATPYPTFTPLSGFRMLGNATITPTADAAVSIPETATATPTQTPTTPAPDQQPIESDQEISETATPGEVLSGPRITMVFTGQIIPARCVQAETEARGEADYIYESVKDTLSTVDLTIGTLNAGLLDFGLTTGCFETFMFVGRSIHAEAMANAGFDVMSVATNHIKDCFLNNCEDQGFVATLENLTTNNIIPVGGGLTRAEAKQPKYIEISGVTFAFVSLGELQPPSYGNENSPAIGVLTEEILTKTINEAKEKADFVIFLPHWGPEASHYPSAAQMRFAKAAVAAGADLIVGNHTQFIQSYVEIKSVPVYFGLGNFVFDQGGEPERQQSLILRVTFEGAEIIATEVIPAVNNTTGAVRVANQQEYVDILTEIQAINTIVQLEISAND